jgi:hypothetical protein
MSVRAGRSSALASDAESSVRDVVFISKATPGDDEFALWLAPRLEAAGYKVFVDVKSLRAGDDWRQRLTETLRDRSIKMLLCSQDSTLSRDGVREEISIAKHVARSIRDERFIIPLKLQRYQPVFGIASTQYVDFEGGWAKGLATLLDEMDQLGIPKAGHAGSFSSNWETYRRSLGTALIEEPEVLTSNWVRITEWPDDIFYYMPTGAIDLGAFEKGVELPGHPVVKHHRGVFTFLSERELNERLASVARFELHRTVPLREFLEDGVDDLGLDHRAAANILMGMLRLAWERELERRGFLRYAYSKTLGFHVGDAQLPLSCKVSWGRQGERRSAMLRNIARGKAWSFGVSALPSLWPFPHFKLKARVLFSDLHEGAAGAVIDDTAQQFRLRRRNCKGWRNKQWHGRMMAYLEVLSGELAWVEIPLGEGASFRCDAQPMLLTAPVRTAQAYDMEDDAEEDDPSLLGGWSPSEESE